MSKSHAKRIKIREFTLTSHVQNSIADPKRNLKKLDILDNLLRKPIAYEPIKYD